MKKQRWIFGGVILAVLLCGLMAWRMSRPAPMDAPVEKLELVPASVTLPLEGVTIGFRVKGYTADGRPAAEEQMAALELVWGCKAEDGAFTVSKDGVVTPLAPGTGNLWVRTADGRLNSRPVTVFVEE